MAGNLNVLLSLATALDYPDEDHRERLEEAAAALLPVDPAMASAVRGIVRYRDEHGVEALEELYTQSFDMNPASTLDVGWHLFGETYKRGAFLVGMRQDFREHGLEEGTELPDHLPQVLRLIARLEDGEHAELLQRACVAAALVHILRTLRGKADHPYVPLLEAASASFGAPQGMQAKGLPMLHDGGSREEEALHG